MRFIPSQRKARRTLLVAAAVLLISPIPGSILIDLCPISARAPEVGDTVTLWHALPTTPEILILGSSRTGHCVDTAATTALLRESTGDSDVQIFNAALIAGDPILLKFLAEHLLARGRVPRLVLIETNPDFSGRRNPLLDFAITRQFTARDIVAHLGDIFYSGSKPVSRLLASRLLPFYLHRGHFRAWASQEWRSLTRNPRPALLLAFEATPWDIVVRNSVASSDRSERFARNIRRLRKQLTDYQVSGKTPAALEDVVALCHERGVEVVLFQPPVHSAQRALYGPSVALPYGAFIERLAVSNNCRVVDFSARVPDTMFTDNYHVDFDGRKIASGLLVREVLTPVWRENWTK